MYTCDRGQDVELLLDVKDKKMVLGSSRLGPGAPASTASGVQAGLLGYTPETQTITGTFEKVQPVTGTFEKVQLCGLYFELVSRSVGSTIVMVF